MELNVVMLRKNVGSKELADVIKKSRVSFDKKRFGHVPFDINEVRALASALSLTLEQVNIIFLTATYTTVTLRPKTQSEYT
jgi:hypothetical protein